MKANEIQIGDWLYYKGQFNAFPFKVESITKKKVGYHAEPNDHRLYYIRLSECKPIPLVPEILEKNGFHKEWDEDIILMVCDTIIIEIGDKYKLYKDGKMYLRRVLAPLYYVHELQHALRLCGIEKTIEL